MAISRPHQILAYSDVFAFPRRGTRGPPKGQISSNGGRNVETYISTSIHWKALDTKKLQALW